MQVYLGTGGEARTPSLRFWRPLLYQLSYTRRSIAARLQQNPVRSAWAVIGVVILHKQQPRPVHLAEI